jgi:5-(carboxyamino)imidazole ribonucleotide synthase
MKQLTIGIMGGGQLGRMMCFAAHKLGYKTVIFSDTANSPASFVTNHTIVADYLDCDALNNFINQIDIVTFEFENIPTKSIDFISQHKPAHPNSDSLRITQNRLREKNFLSENNIKVTNYCEINSLADLRVKLKDFNFKAVLKTATMGYDGKGQEILDQNSNLDKIYDKLSKNQLILEKFSDFQQEISVVVARGIDGKIACYAPLTTIHKNSILDKSIYPAEINQEVAWEAIDISKSIISKLNLVGLLAVEFFVLHNGDLLVNELAPRPHNSGHFSMDASYTSQFEQIIRAITGVKLGNPDFHSSGYMKNIIGSEINCLDKYYQNPKAKIHIYGKGQEKDGRKMAHVNILD